MLGCFGLIIYFVKFLPFNLIFQDLKKLSVYLTKNGDNSISTQEAGVILSVVREAENNDGMKRARLEEIFTGYDS